MDRRMLVVGLPGLAVLMLLLAGCGGAGTGSATGSGTYVGRATGTDVFIALVVEDREHLVYVTDGAEISLWLRGTEGFGESHRRVPGYFLLRGEQGRSIQGRTEGRNRYEGFLTLGLGQTFEYTLVRAEGDAGLYASTDDTWTSGWIVLNDGETAGARRNNAGEVEQQTSLSGEKWTDPTRQP